MAKEKTFVIYAKSKVDDSVWCVRVECQDLLQAREICRHLKIDIDDIGELVDEIRFNPRKH